MERQCSNTCNSVEAAMYNIYELTNKSVEEKLQELSTILERIGTQACMQTMVIGTCIKKDITMSCCLCYFSQAGS